MHVQNASATDYYDESDALIRSVVTDPLFARFANAATGRWVTRNLSGRKQFTFNADGSQTLIFDGHVGIGLHVRDTASGQFLLASGHTILTISPAGTKTLYAARWHSREHLPSAGGLR